MSGAFFNKLHATTTLYVVQVCLLHTPHPAPHTIWEYGLFSIETRSLDQDSRRTTRHQSSHDAGALPFHKKIIFKFDGDESALGPATAACTGTILVGSSIHTYPAPIVPPLSELTGAGAINSPHYPSDSSNCTTPLLHQRLSDAIDYLSTNDFLHLVHHYQDLVLHSPTPAHTTL